MRMAEDTIISLQEALRTLAPDLEPRRLSYVALTSDWDGITVETTDPYTSRLYAWGELMLRSHDLQKQRQDRPSPAPCLDLLALTRWPVLLRLVGRVLEDQRVRFCTIEAEVASAAEPTRFQVQVRVGDEVRSLTDEVQQQLLRNRARYANRHLEWQPSNRPRGLRDFFRRG
jgi:hypothetical protein